MTENLSRKLINDFPTIYTNSEGEQSISHFECGDGWFDLLYKLSSDLEGVLPHLYEEAHDDEDWTAPYAIQVKEKFGGLRFYTHGYDPTIDDFIKEAEAKSERTCETCGLPGIPRNNGWIVTLCDTHAAQTP